MIIKERNFPSESKLLYKAASGAIEYINIFEVSIQLIDSFLQTERIEEILCLKFIKSGLELAKRMSLKNLSLSVTTGSSIRIILLKLKSNLLISLIIKLKLFSISETGNFTEDLYKVEPACVLI